MLQWKPRLIVLLVLIVVVAVALGQLTWEAFDQLTW
jgi:DNA-binding transcriptional regulator of glucitol operon